MRYFQSLVFLGCIAATVGCTSNERIAEKAERTTTKTGGEESRQKVRVHFNNFVKSKSGATWMSCPDGVKKALSGLSGIKEIVTDIERDDMIFTIDPIEISEEALLEAIGGTPYKATVVSNESVIKSASSTSEEPKRIAAPPILMEALGQSQIRNVPLILKFTAPWCGACKKLEKETLQDENIGKLINENAVVLEIDVDEYPEIANHFGVQALPEIVFLSPQGRELKRVSGFQDAETFTVSFKSVLEEVPAAVDLGPRPLTDLADDESQLKQHFNDNADFVRMIVILSPSWGPCLSGARVVQNDVLSNISSDKLKVYIVWTPVLGGDNREAAIDSTKLVYDSRAEHFWDGDQSLGKSFGAAIKLPNDRDLAWDIYFAFDRGVKWDDAMPVPNAWMHQLGYDERHLDGDKLQESVRALVEESESQNWLNLPEMPTNEVSNSSNYRLFFGCGVGLHSKPNREKPCPW